MGSCSSNDLPIKPNEINQILQRQCQLAIKSYFQGVSCQNCRKQKLHFTPHLQQTEKQTISNLKKNKLAHLCEQSEIQDQDDPQQKNMKLSGSVPLPMPKERLSQEKRFSCGAKCIIKHKRRLSFSSDNNLSENSDCNFQKLITNEPLKKSTKKDLLESVGMIRSTDNNQYATAFLCKKRFIVTNAHAIQHFHLPQIQKKKIKNLYFEILDCSPHNDLKGSTNEGKYEKINIVGYRFFNFMKDSRVDFKQKKKNDFAVLMLERQVKHRRSIKMAVTSNLNEAKVQICGFPNQISEKEFQNRQKMHQYFDEGICTFKDGLMIYQIGTSEGSSGSPIITFTEDNHIIVIGIHCGFDNILNKNYGICFNAEIIHQILEWELQLALHQMDLLSKQNQINTHSTHSIDFNTSKNTKDSKDAIHKQNLAQITEVDALKETNRPQKLEASNINNNEKNNQEEIKKEKKEQSLDIKRIKIYIQGEEQNSMQGTPECSIFNYSWVCHENSNR